MPTIGKLVTLDTKSGGMESGAGDDGGDERKVPLDAERERVNMGRWRKSEGRAEG